MNRGLSAFMLCVLVLGVAGCATRSRVSGKVAEKMEIATGFINKTMEVDGKARAYVVYVPRNYDPRKAWPLIVFLHGAGERGDDGLFPTDVGIGHSIRKWPDRFPCLVVFPQCPAKAYWDKAAKDVDTALAKTREEYNVDPHRMYLTGLSLGGYGTWILGAQRTETYAALMPICGGGNVKDAARLARLPIWAFHGADDDVVKPVESRKMVEAVKKAGGVVKYTELPATRHNSWDAAYGDPKVMRWLLEQKR